MINGVVFDVAENSITPYSAAVSVNGYVYTLQPINATRIRNLPGTVYIELLNISYLPALHTINLEVYSTTPDYSSNQISSHNSNSSTAANHATGANTVYYIAILIIAAIIVICYYVLVLNKHSNTK